MPRYPQLAAPEPGQKVELPPRLGAGKEPPPSVLVRVQVAFSNWAWLVLCLIGAGVVVALVLLRH